MSDHDHEDEGRIARLIKEAKLDDSSGEEIGDAAEVTKRAMIADGWVAADESSMPSLPPMRPPPLLPPRIDVPDIFDTKIEYDASHMWNQDLVDVNDQDLIAVHDPSLLAKYTLGDDILGEGACAQVRAGNDKIAGTEVAIKIINGTVCEIVPADLWRQIAQQLRVCKSEYIVSILDDYADENGVYLVLERLPGVLCQALASPSAAKHTWTLFSVSNVLFQLLTGLSVVHANGLVHGDVSSSNVLATDTSLSRVKLCGFAKTAPQGKSTGTLCSSKIKAPEVLATGSGDAACDMWALGCYAYLLLTGDYPFADKNSVVLKTKISKHAPTYPEHVDNTCKEFVSALLSKNPKDRLSPEKALGHAWIKARNESSPSYSVALNDLVFGNLKKSIVM